jgi:hypothetical protein
MIEQPSSSMLFGCYNYEGHALSGCCNKDGDIRGKIPEKWWLIFFVPYLRNRVNDGCGVLCIIFPVRTSVPDTTRTTPSS